MPIDYTDSMIELLDWFDGQPCDCATVGRIAANTGRSRETVRQNLKELRAAGHVERLHAPTGEYRLLEDPRNSDS